MHRDIVAEINTDALVGNLETLRAVCGPRVALCAVLKSNAYGHDASIVGPLLEHAGVTTVAVATITEAIALRDVGFTGRVLCFGPLFSAPTAADRTERIAAAVAYDLTPTLVDGNGARDLDAAARRVGRIVQAHINVDTGMSRLGVGPHSALRLAREVAGLPNVELNGLYTHLAAADGDDLGHARAQLAAFAALEGQLRATGIRVPVRHAANSAALLRLPEAHWDMVRPGLALYGCMSASTVPRPPGLRPVLRLRSHLVLVKRVPAGTPVGYGRTFTTRRESVLGVVPIGYNDGYIRRLSNKAVMGLVQGDAPVVGAISMDQCVLDLTEVPGVKVGEAVTVIDDRPERPNSLESLAAIAETIPYEIVCQLGNRIRRVATGRTRDAVEAPVLGMPQPSGELLHHAAVIRRSRLHTQPTRTIPPSAKP